MNITDKFRKAAKFALPVAAMFLASCEDEADTKQLATYNNALDTTPVSTGFVKGADISHVTAMEDDGIAFYNADGQEKECTALMKSLGCNTIRLRVWVDPADGYNGKLDVMEKALRAQRLGMRIMIDFHYSDTWADPANQTKPSAWSSLDFDSLKTTLGAYTKEVLTDLKNIGVEPEWVQVGNETSDGMLWDDGKASVNPENFAALFAAGYSAAKEVLPNVKVMVHINNAWELPTWILGILKENGATFDMIGLSYYPSLACEEYNTDNGTSYTYATNWKTFNDMVVANAQTLSTTYGVPTMICEYGTPDDADLETISYNCLKDLVDRCSGLGTDVCAGIIYWEPEMIGEFSDGRGAFNEDGTPMRVLDAFAN